MYSLIHLHIIKMLAEKIDVHIYQRYFKNMKIVADEEGNRREKSNRRE